MIETVKVLIEEPEKLKKLIVLLIRFVLISVFTSLLYIHIFDKYELLNIKSGTFWNELYTFFISGNALIVALLYLTLKVVLFDIIAELGAFILRYLVVLTTRKKSHFKNTGLTRFILEFYGIIEFDEKNKVSLGHNYEQFYELLSIYQDKEAKKEIHGLKYSLMNETLHSYFVFTILFFCFMDMSHFHLLTTIVIAGLLVTCFSYFSLSVIIEFFEINGAELLFGLNLYQQEKYVSSFLKEHHILTIENEESNDQLYKKISFNNGEYYLILYPGKTKVMSYAVQRIINRTANNNLTGSILITDKQLSKKSQKLLKANQNIAVIYAKTEKKLRLKLENYFFEK